MGAEAPARFVAGAGIDPAELRLLIASIVGVGAFLWAAWTAVGLYQSWRAQDDEVDLIDLQWGIARAVLVVVLLLTFIR